MALVESSPLRIGLIGLGYARYILLPLFQRHPDCHVIALCGSSLEKTEKVASEYKIENAYDNWRTMIEMQKPDLLAIAVPPGVQSNILNESVTRGIPCFCEKPLTADLAEAEKIVESAGPIADLCAVDFIFPELPVWKQARDVVRSGSIGKLRYASINWHVQTYASRSGRHSWKLDRKKGGGVLNNFVSHILYYVEWMLGEIVSVACLLDEFSEGQDIRATVKLVLAGGASVTIHVSQDACAGSGHRVEVDGDKGRVSLHNPSSDYAKGFSGIWTDASGNEKTLGFVGGFEGEADGRMIASGMIIDRWLVCVRQGAVMVPNIRHGLRVQYLLNCLERSHQGLRLSECAIKKPALS